MTIKGSLHGSIAIVNVLAENFKIPLIIGQTFLGEMGSKCKLLGSSKGMYLRETTLFDVLVVKIGAEGLLLEKRKNRKKISSRVTLYALYIATRRGVDYKGRFWLTLHSLTFDLINLRGNYL